MGRLIEFYVPKNFKPKSINPKRSRAHPVDTPRVVEFPRLKSDEFRQETWIFPEIDSDLA